MRTLVLDLLIDYYGPLRLSAAGRGRVLPWLPKIDGAALVDAIFSATVLGTTSAELVIPQLAANIKEL